MYSGILTFKFIIRGKVISKERKNAYLILICQLLNFIQYQWYQAIKIIPQLQ